MPSCPSRRQFCLWSALGVVASAGCLGGVADGDETESSKPLPESEYDGTDIHDDSAFSVYNNDETQYTVSIRLVRVDTEEAVLDGRYVVPASTGQRVTSLNSRLTYRCRVRLNGSEVSTEYDAGRGQELALRIRDGELKLYTSYLE
jgi:hypothetical protein